jgi:predicted nuclease with TOPRIM domain
MDASVITAIVGAVASVITGFIGYMSGRNNNKLTDRELLSKDEQAFRAELREELRVYKEEIKHLKEEIAVLRKENLELIMENRLLNAKVEELMSRLRDISDKGD